MIVYCGVVLKGEVGRETKYFPICVTNNILYEINLQINVCKKKLSSQIEIVLMGKDVFVE